MTRKTCATLSTLPLALLSLTVPLHGQFLYVANYLSNDVSAYSIDVVTGALTPVAGSPFAAATNPTSVTVDPKKKFAYVAYQATSTNSGVLGYAINSATGALSLIPGSPFVVSGPRSVGVDPSGKFAYSANYYAAGVSGFMIDSTTGALTGMSGSPFSSGGNPSSVALERSGKFAYFANTSSNNVTAYSIDSNTGLLTQIGAIGTGTHPLGVAVDPAAKFLYVANDGSDNVSAYSINSTTGTLTGVPGSPFAAGDFPFSVTVDPTDRFVYVPNHLGNSVSAYAIDAVTGALAAVPGSPFAVPSGPTSVAFDATGRFAYVGRYFANDIAVFTVDTLTGALTPAPGLSVAAGTGPYSLVVPFVDPTISADLSVSKAGLPDPVIRGNNISYTVTVSNRGPFPAMDVNLDDQVPADTKFVSTTAPAGWNCTSPRTKGSRSGVISCTIGSLAVGATASFTIVVDVNNGVKEGTNITNTATVSSGTFDPDAANNQVTTTTAVIKK